MSPDVWGNDPDRTTRREAFESEGFEYSSPVRVEVPVVPPPVKRDLSPWLVTGLLAATLLIVVLAFVGATS